MGHSFSITEFRMHHLENYFVDAFQTWTSWKLWTKWLSLWLLYRGENNNVCCTYYRRTTCVPNFYV